MISLVIQSVAFNARKRVIMRPLKDMRHVMLGSIDRNRETKHRTDTCIERLTDSNSLIAHVNLITKLSGTI
jgi:hypothetical protein